MELTALKPLYSVPGPFASVYLDFQAGVADPSRQVPPRWDALRAALVDQGADAASLDALEARLSALTRGALADSGRAMIAAGGRVLLDQPLPTSIGGDQAAVTALPHVGPLLTSRDTHVPHMLVVLDRQGADIYNYDSEFSAECIVVGRDYPLHKPHAGSWSHRRYHQRVENFWEQNAAEAAAEIDRIVCATKPEILILAGDARARAALRGRLGHRSRGLLVETDRGGRAEGSPADSLREEVERLAGECDIRRHDRLVSRFEEEPGPQDRAVQGVRPTVAAVRRAQVGTLLLDFTTVEGMTLWVGRRDPVELATSESELRDLGVTDCVQERLDDALIAGCAATDAGFSAITAAELDLTDGVGALLR